GVRGTAVIRGQRRSGGQVCILERGYIGDRMEWTSVSFGGGLNNRGLYYGPFEDASRFEKHFSHLMKPLAEINKGYALICGQVEGDMSIRGVNIRAWYQKAISSYKAAGFETRFRPHPIERPTNPLSEDLAGAAVAVTWNSNAGVDAALA